MPILTHKRERQIVTKVGNTRLNIAKYAITNCSSS